jgi:ribosomal subunit interface protein
MNIELVAREVMVNDEVQDRIEKKVEKILERVNKETPVRVLLGNSHGQFEAHVSMNIKGKRIVAQGTHSNMLAALDDALDKADRQCKKHHDKRMSGRRLGE